MTLDTGHFGEVQVMRWPLGFALGFCSDFQLLASVTYLVASEDGKSGGS